MKIHHTGLIVKDIEKSLHIYKKLSYTQISEVIFDQLQNIRVCFIESEDKTQVLELIESIDETSSIYRFKDGYHHICYEVSTTSFINDFKRLKIGKIFSEPVQSPAIDSRQVVFACLSNGIFVEFLLNEELK